MPTGISHAICERGVVLPGLYAWRGKRKWFGLDVVKNCPDLLEDYNKASYIHDTILG